MGKTYTHRYGAKKVATMFDEAMAYQKKDGSIRMFARNNLGELAESYSYDNGETWTEARLTGIESANTRFFVARTPEGRILLINNDDRKERRNMTIYLSEDDGETWKYKRCIDARNDVSYPDADFYGNQIYMVYDRERCGAREILFLKFSEEEIMNGNAKFVPKIVSKGWQAGANAI